MNEDNAGCCFALPRVTCPCACHCKMRVHSDYADARLSYLNGKRDVLVESSRDSLKAVAMYAILKAKADTPCLQDVRDMLKVRNPSLGKAHCESRCDVTCFVSRHGWLDGWMDWAGRGGAGRGCMGAWVIEHLLLHNLGIIVFICSI